MSKKRKMRSPHMSLCPQAVLKTAGTDSQKPVAKAETPPHTEILRSEAHRGTQLAARVRSADPRTTHPVREKSLMVCWKWLETNPEQNGKRRQAQSHPAHDQRLSQTDPAGAAGSLYQSPVCARWSAPCSGETPRGSSLGSCGPWCCLQDALTKPISRRCSYTAASERTGPSRPLEVRACDPAPPRPPRRCRCRRNPDWSAECR
jgi:hypothetical protein